MNKLINDVVAEYYKHGAPQRLGQYFFNTYIKIEDESTLGIFHQRDFNKARVMISQFMANNQWYQLPKKLRQEQPTASRFIEKEPKND